METQDSKITPTPKSWSVGTVDGRVVIVDGKRPIAAFTPQQVAAFIALLIKHTCILISGYDPKVVQKAIDDNYGKDTGTDTPQTTN